MGNEEDITRLRNDVADLYEQLRNIIARVVALEERSKNRDEKIEELKLTIKELETEIKSALTDLSSQVSVLINAPAQRVAGRWDRLVEAGLLLVAGAVVGFLLRKVGL